MGDYIDQFTTSNVTITTDTAIGSGQMVMMTPSATQPGLYTYTTTSVGVDLHVGAKDTTPSRVMKRI